jgi:hypothetical protein
VLERHHQIMRISLRSVVSAIGTAPGGSGASFARIRQTVHYLLACTPSSDLDPWAHEGLTLLLHAAHISFPVYFDARPATTP